PEIVGMARIVEEDVTELVRERERRAIGAETAAILEHHVADRAAVGADERLADPSPPREARHDEDVDRRRVAVVEGLDQRALLKGARDRVDVAEVLEAVLEIDAADAHAERRVRRD